ncbi:FAD:protein FMN transferase [Rasiella sp. SM2506]|uniref:FAD:protein FMN transferase n=1 Tax=Rasiella sp. SM2506 TaxID=3423914 RepID=UPI003D7B934B
MKKLLLLLSVAFVLMSCAEKLPEAKVLQGNAFGTTYSIQYFSDTQFDAQKGLDSVFYLVNKSVNTYIPESDISKINQGDSTIVVDEIFKEVFRISETVYTTSEGYFDPTVGILRNAYGFGDTLPSTEIDSIVLDSLRRFVGFRKVKLLDNGKIQKQYPEIYFDFNAVAKGYGIDKIGEYLEAQGVSDYIIELGGELLAKGKNLMKDQFWTAGIEAIDSELDDRSYLATVRLENKAMASSGNYRKFRINPRTGEKYVHTINPLTGFAEESNVTSATVLASSCGLADAYATAFMAMGLERSKKLLAEIDGIDAYLTFSNSTGTQEVYSSKKFSEYIISSVSE